MHVIMTLSDRFRSVSGVGFDPISRKIVKYCSSYEVPMLLLLSDQVITVRQKRSEARIFSNNFLLTRPQHEKTIFYFIQCVSYHHIN